MKHMFPKLVTAIGGVVLATAGLAGSVDPGVARDILNYVRSSEYHFSADDARLSAPNRSQGLRTHVQADGVRIEPRSTSSDWWLGLRLERVGRGADLREPRGHLRRDPSRPWRAEIVGGKIVQWFANAESGLEHGYDLAEPVGDPAAGPLRLEISLTGPASASRSEGDAAVAFLDERGRRVLRYGGLLAFDAGGRELPATLAIADSRLAIEVDDRDAVYPIVIDPTFTSPDWTAESDQTDSDFGFAVADAGDVNCDGFDDVLVGAERYDNGEVNEGRAFLFTGTAFGLNTAPAWTAESNQAEALFGNSVAGIGNVDASGCDDIAIGAVSFTDGIDPDEGWAFVYHGSPGGLPGPEGNPLNANWTAQGNVPEGGFGVAVNRAGDVNDDGFDDLIVGADSHTATATEEGRAYLFRGSATGLDLAGTRPVGAPSNADWAHQSGVVGSRYGMAVASAGDVNNDGFDDIVVGALALEDSYETEGAAYMYLGGPSGPAVTPSWQKFGERDGALFGFSVDGAGDVNGDGYDDIIIGSPDYTNGQFLEGNAFLYYGTPSGNLGTTPAWTGQIDQDNAVYGFAVAGAGDVNFDGFADVLVGAPGWDNGEVNEGGVFLYYGSSEGLGSTIARTFEVNQEDAQLGVSVSTAGDVQNDSFADIVFGADNYTGLQTADPSEGGAFAYWGCLDGDRDGVCTAVDNCPDNENGDQSDLDADGIGDVCDACLDVDADGACDESQVILESSGPGESVLVQFGTPMTYLVNTPASGDPFPASPLNWTSLFFNDNTWTVGTYGIGYESAVGADDLLNTVVAPGTCSTQTACPFSVYTRSDFFVEALDEDTTVFFGADYDDGVVAWINGVEIFRSNEIPSGDPVWNLTALDHESSNGATPNYGELADVTVAATQALNVGVNVLAVGVWNQSASSSDMVLVPRLSINRSTNMDVRFIANSADPGISPPLLWTTPGFPDVTWDQGNYGLGFDLAGDADDLIHTEVSSSALSVFSRSHFTLDPTSVDSLFLSADYDDGFAAWINGVEVYRSPSVPGGSLAWNTDVDDHESSNGATADYGTPIDISMNGIPALVEGDNVLAIATWHSEDGFEDLVIVPRLAINEANLDNCVGSFNPDQTDTDGDGDGDACDPDIDGDTIANASDNCPFVQNVGQQNADADGLGDACDLCPGDPNNDQDGDLVCEGTGFVAPKVGDMDNCPVTANPDQTDTDGNGMGDACDPDIDGDSVANGSDNCPFVQNPSQINVDGDINGAACDCNDNDNTVWQAPSTIASLRFAKEDSCSAFSCTESGGSCSGDLDCEFDDCQTFQCTMSEGACDDDFDCERDVCQNFTCSQGGNPCSDDTQCTADFCTGKTCTAGLNSCNTNADCTADFCTDKECLETFGPCNDNSDCPGGAGDICIGSCALNGSTLCVSDTACQGDVCEGTCVFGGTCGEDADCAADFCEGECTIGTNGCQDDLDCTEPQTDVCRGTCTVGMNECASVSDCTEPQTDVCQGSCSIGGNNCNDDSVCTLPANDTLVWGPPADFGANAVSYDTLRSPAADDFVSGTTCLDTDAGDTTTVDNTDPTPGNVRMYLVRSENTCPESNMGTNSEGTPRTGRTCP